MSDQISSKEITDKEAMSFHDKNASQIKNPKSRQKVKILKWKPVASWSWNIENDDVCGICDNPFEMAAPGIKWPGDDSPIVIGHCGHAFHIQCIMKWIEQPDSQNTCPICRQYFQIESGNI